MYRSVCESCVHIIHSLCICWEWLFHSAKVQTQRPQTSSRQIFLTAKFFLNILSTSEEIGNSHEPQNQTIPRLWMLGQPTLLLGMQLSVCI